MHKSGFLPIYCLITFKEKSLVGTTSLDEAILVFDQLRNDVFAALRDLQISGILRYSPSLCLTHAPFFYQARKTVRCQSKIRTIYTANA